MYLLNLLYMSLYSVWHQENLFLGNGISISHAYGIAKQYADHFVGLNTTTNELLCK